MGRQEQPLWFLNRVGFEIATTGGEILVDLRTGNIFCCPFNGEEAAWKLLPFRWVCLVGYTRIFICGLDQVCVGWNGV